MKKRYKKRFRLMTDDVNLVLFTLVFERGLAYRYDYKKKKRVKVRPWGQALTYPNGAYHGNQFIIDFFSENDMKHYFGKTIKKHIIGW